MIRNSEHTRSCSVPAQRSFIEPLENRLLLAATPVSDGSIYYVDSKIVKTSFGTFPSYNGIWSMKGDGSAKTLVTQGHSEDLSRLLHGKRWGLGLEVVAGVYPNGHSRQELFAFEIDGPQKVQLTDDPFVQPFHSNWSMDDSFVSFSAVTWTPGPGGDDIYESGGQTWSVDAGIFRAQVNWGGGLPDSELATEVMDADVGFSSETDQMNGNFSPDVVDMQWSPLGTKLVYETDVWLNGPVHSLFVTDFAAEPDTLIALGRGRDAEWKPDGSVILFSGINPTSAANWVLKTVNPAGTVFTQLTKTSQNFDSSPSWSPDGKQIVFTRATLAKGNGYTSTDVMRMSSSGGTVTNLTGSLANNADAFAWRADIQANDPPAAIVIATAPAAVSTAASTPLFSDKSLDDSGGIDGDPILSVLA
jgi:hypothetical protein